MFEKISKLMTLEKLKVICYDSTESHGLVADSIMYVLQNPCIKSFELRELSLKVDVAKYYFPKLHEIKLVTLKITIEFPSQMALLVEYLTKQTTLEKLKLETKNKFINLKNARSFKLSKHLKSIELIARSQ